MTNVGTIYDTAGVYEIEQDNSQYIPNTVDTIVASIGPLSKGPIDEAVVTTNFNEWQAVFGFVQEKYPASLLARDFFQAGGPQLIQVRSAHSDATTAAATVPLVDSTTFDLESLDVGDFYNNTSAVFSYNNAVNKNTVSTPTIANSSSPQTFNIATSGGNPVVQKTFFIKTGTGMSITTIAQDDGAGNITFNGSPYANYSGTINYHTGAVVITISATTGTSSPTWNVSVSVYQTFTLQILQVLKNAAGTVLNGIGQVVFVATNLTPANWYKAIKLNNYIFADPDADMTAFPVAGTYTLSGGDSGLENLIDTDIVGNTLGLTPTGMQIFANPNVINCNVLACPGFSSHVLIRNAMFDLATSSRPDVFPLWDSNPDDTIQSVVSLANSTDQYTGYGVLDTNKGAMYYPYYNTLDPTTNDNMLTPPTIAAACAMAQVNYWEAPAGADIIIPHLTSMVTELAPGDRAYLTANRINPIATYEGMGDFILGQQTATLEPSALDRVANRIVLNRLEKSMKKFMFIFLFKINGPALWKRMTLAVQPYLNDLVNQGILRFAQFKCDNTTNTLQNQENNIAACTFELKLNSFAEQIIMTFHLNRLDATIQTTYTTASGAQLS